MITSTNGLKSLDAAYATIVFVASNLQSAYMATQHTLLGQSSRYPSRCHCGTMARVY